MMTKPLVEIGRLYNVFDAYRHDQITLRNKPDVSSPCVTHRLTNNPELVLVLDQLIDEQDVWIKLLYKDQVGWEWISANIDSGIRFINLVYKPV